MPDEPEADQVMIAEGHRIVRECLRRNEPGPYQVQAATAAVHTDAPTASATDWAQIVQLYDQLYAMAPSDVVWMNRAIALAEIRGPQAALDALETVSLDHFYLLHATRADLLERVRRYDDALVAFDRAIELATNDIERRYLTDRRDSARRDADGTRR